MKLKRGLSGIFKMAAILTGSEIEKREKGLKLIKMIKKVLNRQLMVFLADIFSFEIYTILVKCDFSQCLSPLFVSCF